MKRKSRPPDIGRRVPPYNTWFCAPRESSFPAMPIYAYKCGSCGFAKDVLQKMSDAPLTVCPHCGAAAFAKQVTAAGFQLKGSGWYVTDFRDGGNKSGAAAKDKPAAGSGESAAKDAAPASGATPAASPAPAATSAPAGGGSGSSSGG